jgi:hypothetical protein
MWDGGQKRAEEEGGGREGRGDDQGEKSVFVCSAKPSVGAGRKNKS